ncbi:hypothetical protein ABZ078_18195 [Streptomyces sp. NPDC006385]|uniref:hypothetical protein n=1 Tax=Streptomyces sp. NPDC006385 TaxID=3156761 RepID=UPI0033A59DCE
MGALNQRKGGWGGAEYDGEAVLDELYGTAPPDFVARRGELAAAAKTAGHVADARRIGAARRPTLAAWAANLLLRAEPEESLRFLELGRALREAYRTLDAAEITELSKRRRSIVSALSREAGQLARQAGHRLSDSAQRDVESTLRAVLADPRAADLWAEGRLESALTPPSDFPGAVAPAGGAPLRATSSKPTSPKAPPPSACTRAKDEVAERRRQKQEQLEHARAAADEAAQLLRDRRAEQADADGALGRARDRHEQAQQEVSAAERHLRQAREELQRAEHEQREAEARSRAAADELAQAERRARDTAREVKRLSARRR